MKNIKLSEVEIGKTFKIGDTEFIKFADENNETVAVTSDVVHNMKFGKNNNLSKSDVLNWLNKEFLQKITDVIGEDNVCEFTTDLTSLDGLKTYGCVNSKISLPTLDFYRAHVDIFDKFKVSKWWWLATPDSAAPHWDGCPWVVCVSPVGYIFSNYYGRNGVRPFLRFVSSISVSCEE